MIEESDVIKCRIKKERKIAWKKICSQKQISLTSLIIDSVENRIMNDNLFAKIENNINQVAKITNSQKFISEKELNNFSTQLNEIADLKKQQNEIFMKIYSLIANDY